MKEKFLMIGLILLIACQSNSKTDSPKPADESQDNSTGKINNQLTNQASALTVINFLKWYKGNYETIYQYNLVNNAGGEYDSTKFYSVNFKETEKYLSKLKSGGFISDSYIEGWRKYFIEREENFKSNLQNDGPPDGFEYDFVLMTQEIDETLNSIDNPKLINVSESSDSSVVKIDIMMRLSFSLRKNNNIWLIDRIENLGME